MSVPLREIRDRQLAQRICLPDDPSFLEDNPSQQTNPHTEEDDFTVALRLQQQYDAEVGMISSYAAMGVASRRSPLRHQENSYASIVAQNNEVSVSESETEVHTTTHGESDTLDNATHDQDISSVSESQTEQDDFALAMQIQQEEEAAVAEADRAFRESLRVNENSKVRLKPRAPMWTVGGSSDPKNERVLYSADDAELLATKLEQEHVTDTSDAIDEAEYQSLKGSIGRVHVSEGGQRSILTKHNPHVCGRRHARELERRFPDVVGDMTADSFEGGRLSQTGGGARYEISTKAFNDIKRRLDKSRTATKGQAASGRVEKAAFVTRDGGALDQKTLLMMFKLVNSGYLDEIHGCVKTGKEANVYFAEGWHPEAGLVAQGRTNIESYVSDNECLEEEIDFDVEETSNSPQTYTDDHDSSHAHAMNDLLDSAKAVGQAALAHAVRRGPERGASARGTVDSFQGDTFRTSSMNVQPFMELMTGTNAPVALKIFRLRLTEFSNRIEYIEGDFRFRHAKLNKQNARKLVTIWARKEFANLCRIYAAGIPCPQPLLVRQHIILLSFIGTDGWPAPQLHELGTGKLKSHDLKPHQWQRAYFQTVRIICALYHRCHLVHADLSERNLLWYKKRVWVIDVAQAVELNHPAASEFLERDARNVTEFFARRGASVLPYTTLLEFIRDGAQATDASVCHRYSHIPRSSEDDVATNKDVTSYEFASSDDPVVERLKALTASEQ